MRLALTLMLAAAPALASAGTPDPHAMAERLTTHLGVAPQDADAIASMLANAKAEGEALRAEIKDTAQALKAAKDAGDTRAMRRAMGDLRDLRDELEAMRDSTQARVFERLTVEQQAQWTLHHLRRKGKEAQTLEAVRVMKLQEAL